MSVLVEQRDAVLIITLNRPEQRNALDRATISGIGRALTDAETDDDIAAVVLTGAGDKAFCAGMDLKAFAESGKPIPDDGPGIEVLIGRVYPKPLIGAANGAAVAGGFELLLACDLVVAADHARFGIPEVKRGLVAAGGGVLTLARRLPLSQALELGLTGELIDAQRAYQLGLVNRVVPAAGLLDEALALAALIASNAPLAVRFTKEYMLRSAGTVDARTQAEYDEGLQAIFGSDDAKEGAVAFAERRIPQWQGR